MEKICLKDNQGYPDFEGIVTPSKLGRYFVNMKVPYEEEEGFHEVEIPLSAIVSYTKPKGAPKIDYTYLGTKEHRIMMINIRRNSYDGYNSYTEMEGVLSPSARGNKYFHFRGITTADGERKVNKSFPISALAYLEPYDWLHAPDRDLDEAKAYLKQLKDKQLKKKKLFGIF
jgi:hypothetical protein